MCGRTPSSRLRSPFSNYTVEDGQRRDSVVRQAVLDGVVGEFRAVPPAQAAARADPQVARAVLQNGADIIVPQTVAPGEMGKSLAVVAGYPTTLRRKPDRPFPVLDDRPHFVALRRLAEHHATIARPHVEFAELSMGMSADYEVAVACGATHVRVGTAIFGHRPSYTGPTD